MSFSSNQLIFVFVPFVSYISGESSSSQKITKESSTVDPSKTFPLNHLYNMGIALVNKLLNKDNYDTWIRLTSIALIAKNKTRFANGWVKKPSPNDDYFLPSKRCNDMGLIMDLNSMKFELASNVIYAESAVKF